MIRRILEAIHEKEFTPRGDVLEPADGKKKYAPPADAWGKPGKDYYFSDESPFGLFTFFQNTVQDANEMGGVDDSGEYLRLMNQIAAATMNAAHALPASVQPRPQYPPPQLKKGQGAGDQWLYVGNIVSLLTGDEFGSLSDTVKMELLNAMAEEAVSQAWIVKHNYADDPTVVGVDPVYPEGVTEKVFTPKGDVLEPAPVGKWVKEFGAEYAVPREVLEHPGMEDTSWHNEGSPSFGASKGEPADPSDPFVMVRLFVDHPDPEKRHYPGTKRYTVYVMSDEQPIGDPSGLFDQSTDDLGEALAWWDEQRAKYLGGDKG